MTTSKESGIWHQIVLAACLLLASSAWAQVNVTSGSMEMEGGMRMKSGTASHGEMQQAMMSAPMSGDPDKDFVSMMIPHHQGAIEMAKIELKQGRDAKLRKMAEKIIEAQEKEIKGMKEDLARLEKGAASSKGQGDGKKE